MLSAYYIYRLIIYSYLLNFSFTEATSYSNEIFLSNLKSIVKSIKILSTCKFFICLEILSRISASLLKSSISIQVPDGAKTYLILLFSNIFRISATYLLKLGDVVPTGITLISTSKTTISTLCISSTKRNICF